MRSHIQTLGLGFGAALLGLVTGGRGAFAGQPALVFSPTNNDWVEAPTCTDNFAKVEGGFEYSGQRWYSVENAYQALKFVQGSLSYLQIVAIDQQLAASGASAGSVKGMDAWKAAHRMGNVDLASGMGDKLASGDATRIKKELMYQLHLAKYSQHPELVTELLSGVEKISTESIPVMTGKATTADWADTNGAIQMIIYGIARAVESDTGSDEGLPRRVSAVLRGMGARFAGETSTRLSSFLQRKLVFAADVGGVLGEGPVSEVERFETGCQAQKARREKLPAPKMGQMMAQ